jgi:hypothetical protein
MGWAIKNMDPKPGDADWTRVKFGTEQAAKAHAKFLNEEVDRAEASSANQSGTTS